MQFVSRYLVSLSRFLTKTAIISRHSQCLHSLFTQLWDAIFYPFEVLSQIKQPCRSPFNELSQSTAVYSDLQIFTSPCKGDATIRTKCQIRTRDRFGPKTNSAQNFNYL